MRRGSGSPDPRRGSGPLDGLRSASDQVIVAAVLAGQRAAYALLIERHQARVYHALLRMTGSRDDAEELTQEVFYRTYCALASYKPEYRFTTWLHQIASNLGVDFLHHRRREAPPVEDAPGTPDGEGLFERIADEDERAQPEAAALSDQTADTLWRAVTDLPPDFREVLVMRHVLELSYEEIAQATGLALGTVKSRLLRARRRLAEVVGSLIR